MQALFDFVSSVRLARTVEEERTLVLNEASLIRAALRNATNRPADAAELLIKLVFIAMTGAPTSWAQIDAIRLMSAATFSHKMVGYLCLSLILDESSDLSVLVTQTLLRDLASRSSAVQCLALAFIANLGSQEICRAVASEVQKLLKCGTDRVVKFAGMATVRVIRLNPDLSDSYANSVQPLLNSADHGTVIAGINMVVTMIEANGKMAKLWRQFAGPFTKIVKRLNTSRPLREYRYGQHNDPYLQLKCLRALGMIGKGSAELEQVLQTIVSSVPTKKNTGRTLLFQATETIMMTSEKKALRALALNQVGRLLSSKNPNVLYSTLCLLSRILTLEKSDGIKSDVDTLAIQRHKKYIVNCLSQNDQSLRYRALDVISKLVDENNAEMLIPEILQYIKTADSDFRAELVSNIYVSTQKYAPNKKWYFDTVYQLIVESGNYVSIEIVSSFCDLIANSLQLQTYAVDVLCKAITNYPDNQSLIQVSSFVIGEFAVEDKLGFGPLRQILSLPQTNSETKMYLITAISKLAVRFNGYQEAIEIMKEMVKSNNIEVQQRAGEMMNLLSKKIICEEMLAPIAASSTEEEQNPIQIINDISENKNDNNNESKYTDDLIQFVLDDSPQKQQTNKSTTNLLEELDLLSISPQKQQQNNNQVSNISELIGRKETYRGNNFIIFTQSKINPQSPNQYAIQFIFYSLGNMVLNDFKTDYLISTGWKINVQQPDENDVFSYGKKPYTQVVYIKNEQNTPLQIKLNVTYKCFSQMISETCLIKNITL